ncbi:MAG: PadR family transcriptional regulator [Bacteroidetes bacterium]|nr:PadR family transcriptional regulator [Bacteroidota bacterium]
MAKRPLLLTRADEMLLVCILVLAEEAFSTTIKQEMYRRVRKRISVGTLWVALDQLAARGLVTKEARKNPDRKGGRPRVYYALTTLGRNSLKKTRELQERLWKGVTPDPTGGE